VYEEIHFTGCSFFSSLLSVPGASPETYVGKKRYANEPDHYSGST
jgi:hypothetical protein